MVRKIYILIFLQVGLQNKYVICQEFNPQNSIDVARNNRGPYKFLMSYVCHFTHILIGTIYVCIYMINLHLQAIKHYYK